MPGRLFQRLATCWRRPEISPPAAHPDRDVDREAGGIRTVYDLFPEIEDVRKTRTLQTWTSRSSGTWCGTSSRTRRLSLDGLYGIYSSVEYLARNRIPGDLVECGVFLGGSVLAAARFAEHFGLDGRRFYLYDTFAGFPTGTAPETHCRGVVQTLGPIPASSQPRVR